MLKTETRKWFEKWSWNSFGWAVVCFFLLSAFNGLFSYIFDVLLFDLRIGYGYMYFVLFFFSLILYFFYSKLRVPWLGTLTFGLMGIIGIPIEYWLEFLVTPSLKSIWGAVGWGIVYILYGLVADGSILLVKKMRNERSAIFLSGFIFSTGLLILSIIPLIWFYNPAPISTNFLTYAWFLMPFGIIQGALGALLGYHLNYSQSIK